MTQFAGIGWALCFHASSHNTSGFTYALISNWARGTKVRVDQKIYDFDLPYSAFYSQSHDLDLSEARVIGNHALGVYATRWEKQRAGIFVFNFLEHVFQFKATKPSQNASVHERKGRTGVEAKSTFSWDGTAWKALAGAVDDGFVSALLDAGLDAAQFDGLNPVATERVLHLSNALNPPVTRMPWFDLKQLPSFVSTEEEVLRRYTFAQDTHQEAVAFRRSALGGFATLVGLVSDIQTYPDSLRGIGTNWRVGVSVGSPALNFYLPGTNTGMLFAYAGSQGPGALVEIKSRLWDALGPDEKHRFVLWYHRGATLVSYCHSPDITEDTSDSAESYTRENSI